MQKTKEITILLREDCNEFLRGQELIQEGCVCRELGELVDHCRRTFWRNYTDQRTWPDE